MVSFNTTVRQMVKCFSDQNFSAKMTKMFQRKNSFKLYCLLMCIAKKTLKTQTQNKIVYVSTQKAV